MLYPCSNPKVQPRRTLNFESITDHYVTVDHESDLFELVPVDLLDSLDEGQVHFSEDGLDVDVLDFVADGTDVDEGLQLYDIGVMGRPETDQQLSELSEVNLYKIRCRL